jgi:guanine deaminase
MGVAADPPDKVVADSSSPQSEQFMRIALQMAERGLAAGGPPVGACLVRNGEVVAAAHNSVIGEIDITAHAEIAVFRLACAELRSLSLSGCTLYVTLEPCAMCLSASYYAGIEQIVFGAPIAAMDAISGNELHIASAALFAGNENAPGIVGGVLAEACVALLEQWRPVTARKGAAP